MDHRELKKLVQLMNDNGLVELEIEREGTRVHIRKGGESGAYQPVAMHALPPQPTLVPPETPAPTPLESGPPPGVQEIRSPMVGTFYRRPNPEADAYVAVGDRVNDDSVVCIVEAMKVNNEIKAELDGEILEILVEDGHPVEFDQPLFLVKVA